MSIKTDTILIKHIQSKITCLMLSFLALIQTSCLSNQINIKMKPVESDGYTLSPSNLFIAGNTTIDLKGENLNYLANIFFGNKECKITKRINQGHVQCSSPMANNNESFDVSLKFDNGNTIAIKQKIQYSISSFNQVKLFAGTNALAGAKNAYKNSKFFSPSEITIVGNNLYVADSKNHVIRKINLNTSETTTIIGKEQVPGDLDAYGTDARINTPFGLVSNSTDLFFSDRGNCRVKKYNLATTEVITIAGTGIDCDVEATSDNAIGTLAVLNAVNGLAINGNKLYLSQNTELMEISLIPPYAVSTLLSDVYISTDLTVLNNKIYFAEHYPDSNIEDVAVVDLNDLTTVRIIAGSDGPGDQLGATGDLAKFKAISSITNDGTYLYVSDSYNNKIKKIDPVTGETTLITGLGANNLFSLTGSLGSANIYRPAGIHFHNNSLYVGSYGSHSIFKANLGTNMLEKISGGME